MRFVTASEMRDIDKSTPAWVPSGEGHALMRTAASGIAGFVRRIGNVSKTVVCIIGRGNNGGDALLAGNILRKEGWNVVSLAVFGRDSVPPGISSVIQEEDSSDGIVYAGSEEDWDKRPAYFFPEGTVFLDGVLGTGVRGAPRGMELAAVKWIRSVRRRGIVVSVDIPSGLNPDTGCAFDRDAVVEADVTLCVGMPKTGMSKGEAPNLCGSVHFVDIGVRKDLRAAGYADDSMVVWPDVRDMLFSDRRDAHKGDYGHVCVCGGSAGHIGAPIMSGLGALRGGAGLVSVILPADGVIPALCAAPEMMAIALPGGEWSPENLRSTGFSFDGKVIVAGPGMGAAGDCIGLFSFLGERARASVLDADALNAFAGNTAALARIPGEKVLTPHPGEAARLLSCSVADVQCDRERAVRKLAADSDAAVVLKGAGTLVCAPGRGVARIPCGNPRMACGGGMGDVLAGLIGALLGRGLDAYAAACAGAWLHAAAGDEAFWESGLKSVTATALAEHIRAFRYG